MAGNYPDAPSRRLAWDDDGTVGLYLAYADIGFGVPTIPAPPSLPLSIMSQTQRENINGEDNTIGLETTLDPIHAGGIYAYAIFPDDRDIDGYHLNMFGTAYYTGVWFYTSPDTTTGHDGTWSTIGVIDYHTDPVNPSYRENVKTAATTDVRGAYFGFHASGSDISRTYMELCAFHMYGTPSAAGNPHRFLFLDTGNSDAEYTKLIDDGNVGRGADTAFTVKVKNNSTTQQANTVQMTTTNVVGDSEDWYSMSDDDITYVSTLSLGNIAALGTQLVYVKKAIPDAEVLGCHAARFKVAKASWT